jgi:transposase
MSMQPHPWPAVPASTARVAKRAFRKGSLAMRARDELGAWYQDEAFRVTYGTRGAPGVSPAQLAMVTVLQFTGDLTDRQAADAVRGRLDWKYCLGLELDDEGSGLFRAERVPVPAGGRRDGGGAAGGAAGPAG